MVGSPSAKPESKRSKRRAGRSSSTLLPRGVSRAKVNEHIALAVPTVRKAFADRGVAALQADWTRQDAGITRVLEANGRAGVPMYLFYPSAGATGERRPPIVLPQILTAEIILDALRRN